ncbi:hypothetical protein [Candidatus Odyssella acanthamoebae]|uniref:Uncharacterized protein n=1 Tax=Candidatus Odyssella acanthamoebae TaxID=91604 RepID=A0A077AZJ6_9PROT|nr:hypothetical protein [Candidatus Paracaedibacter acanthamoebae]AIK97128.1 hypothetical protein ID47_10920 [Candidatus Paracaedibacter acanthamoebae]
MKKMIAKLFLIAGLLGNDSWGEGRYFDQDPEKIIQSYQAEANDNTARVKRFQKDFAQALKKIDRIQWTGDLYTYGLMCHLGYTELSPSFVAFVGLYQGLYRWVEGLDSQEMTVPPSVREAFRRASDKFIAQVHDLKSITDIETYESKLTNIFKDFLIGFIKDNQDFFQTRWCQILEKTSKDQAKKLSIIDRAFFALKEGWSGIEISDLKYQFEALYAYRCQDNRVLILGYNDRPITCDRFLHIYVWDLQKPESAPVPLKYLDKAGFDLSPTSRAGGCSEFVNLLNKVHFDGRHLKCSGYEYETYKNYICDVMTGQIRLQS